MTTKKTGGNDKETTRQKEGKNSEAIGNAMGNSRGITRIQEGSNGKKNMETTGGQHGSSKKKQHGKNRGEEQGNNHETHDRNLSILNFKQAFSSNISRIRNCCYPA